MPRDLQVSDTVVIAADARTIYDQVADPTQMPRWSPENVGATVRAAPGPLPVGAVFDGANRRGRAVWSTQCVVTAAEPGRHFAFDVRRIGPRAPLVPARIASWSYHLEPVEDGTRVTETWTDNRRWPDWVAALFDRGVTGGRLFADFQRRNIAKTLANLRADFAAPHR